VQDSDLARVRHCVAFVAAAAQAARRAAKQILGQPGHSTIDWGAARGALRRRERWGWGVHELAGTVQALRVGGPPPSRRALQAQLAIARECARWLRGAFQPAAAGRHARAVDRPTDWITTAPPAGVLRAWAEALECVAAALEDATVEHWMPPDNDAPPPKSAR
jgi:hypothetical protein